MINKTNPPEAFGYCWHRSNGEFYYGVHKGSLDDGYVGSGHLFKKKYKGTDKSEWKRTVEFRGTFDECLLWEADMVTWDLVNQPLCLNLTTGGRGTFSRENSLRASKIAADKLRGVPRPEHSKLAKERGFADVMNVPEVKERTSEYIKSTQSHIINTPDGKMRLRDAVKHYGLTRPAISHRCKSNRWPEWEILGKGDGYLNS